MKHSVKLERLIPAIGAIFLLFVYHLTIYRFFPNTSGHLGHDYSYFLPQLLNGIYWYRENGLFEVPWYTPGFCGGLPFFPNPQNIYYSLPQLLTLYLQPVQGIYLSVIIFATLGFVGTYLLARKIFTVSASASFLGATIFLFNGFFSSRMMIGHLTYQVFALLPLLACVLLYDNSGKRNAIKNELVRIIIAAMILAYMFYAGAANFIIPVAISLLCLSLIYGVITRDVTRFWIRSTLAALLSLVLIAPKLYPAILFISEFRTNLYTLPGFDGIWTAVLMTWQILFGSYDSNVSQNLINAPIEMAQHEFEYGVTYVPFVLMFIFPIMAAKLISRQEEIHWQKYQSRIIFLLLLAMFLMVPVAINTYYLPWNELLKKLPYINVSTSLIRWISIYIPVLAILSSLAVDLISKQRVKLILSIGCIAYIILSNFNLDRSYYQNEQYLPELIEQAWSAGIPPVTAIGNNPVNEDVYWNLGRNDLFTFGISQSSCYEPVFGYGMETFPVGSLHTGSVMDVTEGVYNIKNPACYVFPEVNQCVPGDHFFTSAADKIELFIHYRPFEFSMPLTQKVLNFLSLSTLLVSILFLMMILIFTLNGKKRS